MDFLVARDDLHRTRTEEAAIDPLDADQIRVRIDAFAFTANNITYAVFGDAMQYWNFYPAPDGWGRVPVWGFADVVESRLEGIDEGVRLYGFLPMSHDAALSGRVTDRGFTETSEHRRDLPAVYNSYSRTDTDSSYDASREAQQMLLRPLFTTSWLIDDFLADAGHLDAQAIVIGSASSKTAIGTAFCLHERGGVDVVGLTSAANAEFVTGLGIYDQVFTYDALDELGSGSAVYVDMSGSAGARGAVHAHYGDQLRHSAIVGATHWDEATAAAGDLVGPAPTLFFAPDRITQRVADWGSAGLDERVDDTWKRFGDHVDTWLEVVDGAGVDAVESTYREVLEGKIDPRHGHVLTMHRD